MKNFLFFFGFLCVFHVSHGQCPFPVTLQTKAGYCVGDTLFVNSANSLSSITWYQGTSIVKTVTAVNLGSGITVAGGNGMGSAANQFFSPQSVSGDASGNIYVADALNNRIQKFPPGSTSVTNGITVAGGNGLGSAADQLWDPLNVFSDNSGNLYIADVFNQRIQEWMTGASTGFTVAGGNGAGAAANQFNDPYSVFVDPSGNIYVADWLNSRVQKWAPGAASGVTVAGGNGAGAASNQLNLPTNVFVDAAGNIYITDRTNERIQKWAPGATSGVTVAGGNGIGSAANQLDAPFGIFVDASGNLYVADYSNSRVQKFPPGSTGATNGVTVAGGNGFGNAANQFDGPSGVYVNNAGSIYVCDLNNQRVQKWEQVRIDTTYVPSAPGSYTAQVMDNASCTVTTLPVVINPILTAAIQITESANTICSGTGSFTAAITNGGSAPVYQWKINGVNSGANSAILTVTSLIKGDEVTCMLTSNAVCALPASVSSNIIKISGPPLFYLLNKGNQCLGKDTLMITSTDTISKIVWYNGTTIAHTENAVNATGTGITVAGGNGMGVHADQFINPLDVCLDAAGNIYVSDRANNRVQKWAPGATSGVTVAGGNGQGPFLNQLDDPTGICLDPAGNLYIADHNNNRIQKWAPGATTGITVAGGNGVGNAANQFNSPWDVCLDGAGYIYVVEQTNNRVQKFPPNSTGATNGVTVVGLNGTGFGADQLANPVGLFVTNNGTIYIADNGNSRIQEWLPGATSGVTVAGGNGQGPALNQLDAPIGLYVDAAGYLYIADESNNRIIQFPPGSTGASNGVVVAGGNGMGSASNQLSATGGVFVDASGNIFMTDYLNNRVQKWGQLATIDTSYIPATAGSYTAVVTNSAGCVSTSPAIDINPTIITSVNIQAAQTAICGGSPANFSVASAVGGTAPVFQWQLDGVDVGTNSNVYTNIHISDSALVRCIMTNNALCPLQTMDTSNIIQMIVNPNLVPAIQIAATDSVICKGKLVNFQATAKNAGVNMSYQWMVNGVGAGNNNSLFSSSSLNDGDMISCQLTADPLTACVNPASAHSNDIAIHVNDSLQPSIQISSSLQEICPGDPVSFQALTQHAGNEPLYQWTINGKPVGGNEDHFSSSAIQDGDLVSCLLTAVHANCSTGAAYSSNIEQLTVKPAPQITAITADTIIKPHQQVKLNVSVTGTTTSFAWSPSDKLIDPLALNPTTVPLGQTTTYLFSVSGTDGCTSTETVVVKVFGKFNMPNAFTPNGDQKNDLFRIPPNTFISLKEFSIYDRWGARVFSSRDISKGWDGNFNGTPCVAGTYVYIVSGSDENGNIFQKGTVLLIR
jgi:gliding motility-associated-like protein